MPIAIPFAINPLTQMKTEQVLELPIWLSEPLTEEQTKTNQAIVEQVLGVVFGLEVL